MDEKMKAAFLLKKGQFDIREVDRPVPGDDEVLIRIKHVGVCGADIEFFADGNCFGWVIDEPSILGHEPAGEVAGFGKNVTGFRIGDNVCVEPGEPCRKCEYCKKGLYNLCADVKFHGVPGIPGAFREYMAISSDLVFKLPDNVTTLEGALAEPLAVGFQAASQANAKPGMTAVIFGAGCIGLMILFALKVCGISEIYVVDLLEKRLNKAEELGAKPINALKTDAAAEIKMLTNGAGADLVFEAVGSKSTTLQTVDVTKRGGTITFVGLSTFPSLEFNINGVIGRQLTVKSVFRYANQFPVALEAMKSGRADVKKVISDMYKFENIQAGLEKNAYHKADVIKEVIEF